MTDHPNLPRMYGDKEIGQILKRATELQDNEPSAAPSSGLTLQELEEVAIEAGIDPRFLQRAASELETDSTDSGFWAKVVGDELILLRDTMVSGELTDDGFERIAAAIQSATREYGQPTLIGRSLTWRAETFNKSRTVHVTVTSRDGQTHVGVEENLHQLAAGLFGGVVGGGGFGIGVGFGLPLAGFLSSGLMAAAFPVCFLGLSYIGAREIYRTVTSKRRSVMGNLFDGIVVLVHACVEDRREEGAQATGRLPAG